jgi:hypothetical protein
VDLRNANIGVLPESLGDIPNLQYLNLESCGLTGPFPAVFRKLKALKEFEFWGSDLEGDIPEYVCEMQNLERFYIGENLITGRYLYEVNIKYPIVFWQSD